MEINSYNFNYPKVSKLDRGKEKSVIWLFDVSFKKLRNFIEWKKIDK